MSRTARITAEFGGEERDFRLAWGELMDLQEKRDAGPAVVLARLSLGQWMLQDVTETIRLGLIGAGMDSAQAARLVRQHVEQKPWDLGGDRGLVILAVKILAAATHGAPDEPAGKAEGDRSGSTISQTERSDSAPSSAMLS
jgi:hypothetical protein